MACRDFIDQFQSVLELLDVCCLDINISTLCTLSLSQGKEESICSSSISNNQCGAATFSRPLDEFISKYSHQIIVSVIL